jgi:transposase
LAHASGIATPTREDLARVDRKRKKKGSNKDWVNPHDPDARITKMKDGCTHLAHKAEHAVDMDTGAVLAVTLQEADLGDTTTVKETLAEAGTRVAELIEREADTKPLKKPRVNLGGIEEVVADKGYHSGPVLKEMRAAGVRTYIPEKKQAGKRHWVGKEEEQQVVYANRRMIRPADAAPLGTIRSLAYFSPVIEEVLQLQVGPDYFQYLRHKLKRAAPAR